MLISPPLLRVQLLPVFQRRLFHVKTSLKARCDLYRDPSPARNSVSCVDVTRRSAIALGAGPVIVRAGETFEAALDGLCMRHLVPGLSAMVIEKQKPVLIRSYGFRDVEVRSPVTAQTPFRIASLTKTFSSTLLMQLYQSGRLNLDEPIGPYIPNDVHHVPFIKALLDPTVKIRHVLTHTSETPPGTRFRYDGARFNALTPVIEKVAGTSLRELLAQRILDPLKMTRSVPGQDATAERYQEAIRDLAKPYAFEDGRLIPGEYPPARIRASAGLISTVEDLARFDAAIDRHELIKPESQEIAWTPPRAPNGKSLPYGLGGFIQRYSRHKGSRDPRLVWHYGYWPTFSALYLKVLAQERTLLLLANSDGLSRPFPSLGAGNVEGSDFARLFLAHFG
jgi:CubicO group peptidase (beta-lactamase class C family)